MQEGTPPATGKWMEIVNNIFEDYKDWILLIHDNMLILAHTNEELFERIKQNMFAGVLNTTCS